MKMDEFRIALEYNERLLEAEELTPEEWEYFADIVGRLIVNGGFLFNDKVAMLDRQKVNVDKVRV
jgi:hypothetical protein